jgi:hypothetical protein
MPWDIVTALAADDSSSKEPAKVALRSPAE